MTLYAEYLKERFGYSTITESWGFISYSFVQPFCRIEELYVVPEERLKGRGRELADRVTKIAQENECKCLWSQVQTNALNASEALSANLAYGFKVIETDSKRIILLKEIGG